MPVFVSVAWKLSGTSCIIQLAVWSRQFQCVNAPRQNIDIVVFIALCTWNYSLQFKSVCWLQVLSLISSKKPSQTQLGSSWQRLGQFHSCKRDGPIWIALWCKLVQVHMLSYVHVKAVILKSLDCTFCILLKCSRVVYTVYSSWLLTGSVQANEFHHIRWFLVTDGRASQIGIDLFFLDQDFGIEFLNMSASLSVSVVDWLQHWIFFAPVAVYYCLLQWKFSSIPTHCAPNHQSTIPVKHMRGWSYTWWLMMYQNYSPIKMADSGIVIHM